uniref:Uncharacterized protein n=1 Tax=Sphaerodactylus townsendi TaxID=933632 RepID=A0ACB8EWA1_9SAUR
MIPATVGLLWSLALLTIVSAQSDRFKTGVLCDENLFLAGVKEVCSESRKRNLHDVHYQAVSELFCSVHLITLKPSPMVPSGSFCSPDPNCPDLGSKQFGCLLCSKKAIIKIGMDAA